MAKTSAYQIAVETASKNSNYVRAELDVAVDTVRTLSYTFQAMKLSNNVNRETMDNILINVLKDNPKFIATWTLWEPNALDGRDTEYIGKAGYDKTGRFIPYWSRQNGEVHREPLVNYEMQGAGDYYLIPKKSMRETVIEPYVYPIGGKEVWVTSVVVPLIVEGEFTGVVGIDISLDTIKTMVSEIKPLGTGYAGLISNKGMYVAHRDISQIGKIVEDNQSKEMISLGKTHTMTNKGIYEIYVPISIGRTTTPWSMEVGVPSSIIFENADDLKNYAIILGIVAILVIGFVIFFVESSITDKHLRQENFERMQILESMTDGFWATDGNLQFTYINRAGEEIFGKSREELVGKRITDIFRFKHATLQYFYEALSEKKSVNFEIQSITLDNKWIEVCLYPKDNGLTGYFRDITSRKKSNEEFARLDRLKLVGQLAAGIAHEIRNPMTTVRGYLQLLGAKPAYVAQKPTFELMISELDRANSIITEFLSLAQTKPTELKSHNLNDILKNLYPLLEADTFTQNKQIHFIPGKIPKLNLNGKEISQLIINLAHNGLEAMGSDGSLTIKSYVEGENVVLMIKDEGCGIPQENHNKLGVPFFTTKDDGTGLGLAICYKIAESHNAKVHFDSTPSGTTFFIHFPFPEKEQLHNERVSQL